MAKDAFVPLFPTPIYSSTKKFIFFIFFIFKVVEFFLLCYSSLIMIFYFEEFLFTSSDGQSFFASFIFVAFCLDDLNPFDWRVKKLQTTATNVVQMDQGSSVKCIIILEKILENTLKFMDNLIIIIRNFTKDNAL